MWEAIPSCRTNRAHPRKGDDPGYELNCRPNEYFCFICKGTSTKVRRSGIEERMKIKILEGVIKVILLVPILLAGTAAKPQVRINEFLAYNATRGFDPATGNFSDWIELHNAGEFPVHLGGYFLTDNLGDTTKWTIPTGTFIYPNDYLLIWADGLGTGLHTSFKLSSDGEEIALFTPAYELVDALVYVPQQTDISFGRYPDGQSQWHYFGTPTPGSGNMEPGLAHFYRGSPPQFSIPGGLHPAGLLLELTAESTGTTIRYTLDGNEPREDAAVYTGPIAIDETTVVRARAFTEGKHPSPVVTHTYFINIDKDLPVFSLVCDSAYLWDEDMGIYLNSAIDQERAANIEYFEDEQGIINQPVGIQIHGFVARYLPQKIFSLNARSKYGPPALDHKFFLEKEIHSFPSIFLRNGGFPENSASMLRDGLMQNLVVGKVDLDYMAYRPAVLYLNGEYWGLYNIREKQGSDYLAANRNINPSNIDFLENFYMDVIDGSIDHFMEFMDFITGNDVNNPANYQHIKEMIDVDNLIDYMITEIYYANTDWPGANQKYWRSKEENGRWRWILTDVEFGFGMEAGYDHNTLEFALAEDGTTWANPPAATYMLRRMLENDSFRDEFIQRFAARLNLSFEPSTVIHRIDSFRNNVVAEMPLQIERWKDEAWISGWGQPYHVIESMDLWEAEIEEMREFALKRPSHARQHIIEKFTLDGLSEVTTGSDGGYILANSVRMPEGNNSGYYFTGVPLRLEAVPEPGMQFLHWIFPDSLSEHPAVSFPVPPDDLNLVAVFVPANVHILPGLIVNDLTLLSSAGTYVATSDIIIFPDKTLEVQPGVEILMPDSCSIYVYGQLTVNGTAAAPCTIRPNPGIKATRWGAICIQDATGEVALNHLNIEGASTGRDKFLHKAGITSLNSDVTLNHVSLLGADFPFYSEYGNIVIRNSYLTSDKTCDMINVKYASSALVDSCVISGNEYPDTDGIDYDQIQSGVISNNIISGFAGFNSDGIDIGEEAKDILIENNRIYNCSDKGISVGQASTAIIRRNFISGCNLGVGVKDSLAHATIDQNTFYRNNYAVACFEKNWGAGGGSATVKNSILSQCSLSPVLKDSLSTLTVTYTLSDTDPLDGEGNILEDPEFVEPLIMNFELKGSSPCIDAGDPSSPPDPDGSPADMGAYFVFQAPDPVPLVINEVNYNSHPDHNAGDWIEVYNGTGADINLSGWIFRDGEDLHSYRFPENFILEEEGYLVLVNNVDSFQTIYPGTWNFRGPFAFGLNRQEETLRLFDPQMNLMDLVEYTNQDPWPEDADGQGHTMQLLGPWLDNNLAQSWAVSDAMLGNPGEENFVSFVPGHPAAPEIAIRPNPASGIVHVNPGPVHAGEALIEVINLHGKTEIRTAAGPVQDGNEVAVDLRRLPRGIYILKVVSGNRILTGKLILH